MVRCLTAVSWVASAAQAGDFSVVARVGRGDQAKQELLVRWDEATLKPLKRKESNERDPQTGATVSWSGVLLSEVLEKSLKKHPIERQSLYDLLIVRGAQGSQALIPRAFVIKYPILLADRRDGKSLAARAPMTVMPWTSNSKIRGESAPLRMLFVEGVSVIELANFKEQFPEYLLKRRTEPAAVRGEKLFREACIGCHAVGRGPKVSELSSDLKLKMLLDSGHPPVDGLNKISAPDRRALVRFLEMLRE